VVALLAACLFWSGLRVAKEIEHTVRGARLSRPLRPPPPPLGARPQQTSNTTPARPFPLAALIHHRITASSHATATAMD
jgi:hypothetical protein